MTTNTEHGPPERPTDTGYSGSPSEDSTREPLPPIDGKAWSYYTEKGREHFDCVRRSWSVFARNSNELVSLLHSVETDAWASILLMQDAETADAELLAFQQEFWSLLDQHLHNLVAATGSLVDHTRPLVRFYENNPDFQQEFAERNAAVAISPRASFLSQLRNYLLHCGPAPMVQTMWLGLTTSDQPDHLSIQLSTPALLEWPKWGQAQRAFIEDSRPGPPLRNVCESYVNDMRALYTWLFKQYSKLHVPGEPPPHLAEGCADWVSY